MSDDQLRAKSLAVFHALVSTWSNDLRKEVSGLQDDLLKKLDVLQEQMSKYDDPGICPGAFGEGGPGCHCFYLGQHG